MLLWAHYSNGYKGFCLEFRTDYEPFNKLHKVNYVSKFPEIDFVSEVLQGNSTKLIELYCTKSKVWKYEKEWRVIHTSAGTEFIYKPECLKAVYFGPKMDSQYKEIICLILQGQNPNVELWDGQLSEKEFKIQFKKFRYLSYVQAKKMGLKD